MEKWKEKHDEKKEEWMEVYHMLLMPSNAITRMLPFKFMGIVWGGFSSEFLLCMRSSDCSMVEHQNDVCVDDKVQVPSMFFSHAQTNMFLTTELFVDAEAERCAKHEFSEK